MGSLCEGIFTYFATPEADGRTTLTVSVGGIWHDTCCVLHPLGYACQKHGTKTADEANFCKPEWDKAFNTGKRGWKHSFGPYPEGVGDDLTGIYSNPRGYGEKPATLKLSAPDGTELDDTDAAYCQSGSFASTSAFWHSGICGVPPAQNPPSQ
jgi:hypothetical protein